MVIAAAVGTLGCGDDDDNGGRFDGGMAGDSGGRDGGGGAGRGGTGGRADGGAMDGGVAGADAGRNDAGDAGANLSDSQIAGVMRAANAGEVEQGELAVDRAENAEVDTFAMMMVEMHTDANERLDELLSDENLSSASSTVSEQLTMDSMAIIDMLEDESGAAFDLAYMQAQRTVHAAVLEIIDSTLLPSVDNDALRDELEAMRDTVNEHLERAEEILDALSGADAGL